MDGQRVRDSSSSSRPPSGRCEQVNERRESTATLTADARRRVTADIDAERVNRLVGVFSRPAVRALSDAP